MNTITHFKQYLSNWPNDKYDRFWQQQVNFVKSIPRILIIFILPFILAAYTIKLLEFLSIASIPVPQLWGFILGIIYIFIFAHWLKS